jgi:cobalt-zinc-cadmium efflux system outer membrane protein
MLRLTQMTVAAALLAGCVSSNAGYDDVRTITAARLGEDVRWHEKEEEGRTPRVETRRLLAAPLTADAAARLALLNSPSLQASFERLGIARGELVHALRLPNPEVGAALRYHGGERPEIDIDATLSISELVLLPFRKGAAGAGLEAAKLEVAQSASDLAFAARRGFYDYQAAAEKLELRRTAVESLGASADFAKRLHDAGNVTDLVLASQQALHEEARIAFGRAEAELSAERERLSALMGIWGAGARSWTARPRLPDPAPIGALVVDLEKRAIDRSLDLLLSRRRLEAADSRADLSRLEGWVPDLRAGVSAERGEGDWGVGPVAELEVPLFYQGQGETDVALAEARRERNIYADIAIRVRARANALAARLSSAEKAVRYYRETLLPLGHKVVSQTLLEYNAMSAGLFQLLQAKRDQIAAAESYVALVHDYWILRSDVEQLLAGRLTESSAVQTSPGDTPATSSTGSGGH